MTYRIPLPNTLAYILQSLQTPGTESNFFACTGEGLEFLRWQDWQLAIGNWQRNLVFVYGIYTFAYCEGVVGGFQRSGSGTLRLSPREIVSSPPLHFRPRTWRFKGRLAWCGASAGAKTCLPSWKAWFASNSDATPSDLVITPHALSFESTSSQLLRGRKQELKLEPHGNKWFRGRNVSACCIS